MLKVLNRTEINFLKNIFLFFLIKRLEIGEGMVIGSTSSSLALVHGETIESEYVPSRPFRVNAGSIHSYVLMADKSTKYLSELSAGDEVAIISYSGKIRKSIIGRLKIVYQ